MTTTATLTHLAPPAPAPAATPRPHTAAPRPPATPTQGHARGQAQAAPQRAPRPVRATVHAGGLPVELLLGTATGPASSLDVDPRLLIVHRPAPQPVEVARRTLSAPSDERRERRERRRRLVLTTAAGFAGAVVAGLSVATALA